MKPRIPVLRHLSQEDIDLINKYRVLYKSSIFNSVNTVIEDDELHFKCDVDPDKYSGAIKIEYEYNGIIHSAVIPKKYLPITFSNRYTLTWKEPEV